MTSAASPTSTPARRTQEQRSAQTRARVLDAAIECLVADGYAATTTKAVAERAGVTRGAILHHFPSHNDLVAAAVTHLAVKRAEEALHEFTTIAEGTDLVGQSLDLLWRLHQGPLFAATIELMIASRTDRQLATEVEKVEPVVGAYLSAVGTSLSPKGIDRQKFLDFAGTALDAVQGLLISGYSANDPMRREQRWQRLRKHLLWLGEHELAASLAGSDQP